MCGLNKKERRNASNDALLYKYFVQKIAVSKVLKIWQNRLKWGYGIRDPGAKKPSS